MHESGVSGSVLSCNPYASLHLNRDDGDDFRQLSAFHCQQTRTIPTRITISTHHHLIPPTFERQGPTMEASIGHVLPPSLDEANAGESADSGVLLPVSWQRLHHDPSLLESDFNPSIVVLVDAVQLAAQSGKLVKAIQTLKHRFPEHYSGHRPRWPG